MVDTSSHAFEVQMATSSHGESDAVGSVGVFSSAWRRSVSACIVLVFVFVCECEYLYVGVN